jgi:hypothetical protein
MRYRLRTLLILMGVGRRNSMWERGTDMRMNFTTRDWVWFWIVMGLAIGWGTHVRYTAYLEAPYPYSPLLNEKECRMRWQSLSTANSVDLQLHRELKKHEP